MLTLEAEVVQLQEEGLLSPEAAAPLIAEERHEIVTVYTEVRALAWLGVMFIAGGAGVLVSRNLDRIGPIAVAAAIGLAAAGCYGYTVWRRTRGRSGALDESILLLGALLLSTDIGYLEYQFHFLGSAWPRHFVLLALIHGVTAYVFDSAALLSLSIAALASWLGIERNVDTFFTNSLGTASRAFGCAALVTVWRFANRRAGFERVFDHFIANLALWGGLILTFNRETRDLGALVVIVMAALAMVYGFRKREEAFLIYSLIYAVLAIDVAVVTRFVTVVTRFNEPILALFYLVVSTIAAIVALFQIHLRFRKAAA
ncbi:MAG TPA: DUF2157 domain-containing protein [Thermoanaerobaculia bacterium]|nr:DUF2157 domain-containing protein [Thermoanaerobaculia bacterium]